jgi:phospholipid transport system transporter-binding protein
LPSLIQALARQAEPTLGRRAPGIEPGLLVLPAEITHAQANGCLRLLLTAAYAASHYQTAIVIDAAPLTRFDSSVLAVLIECRRAALRTDKRFAVRGVPSRLAELARLYGVARLLGMNTSA